MSEFYKPRHIYILDIDKCEIIGRELFIIGGEMSGGLKCWYRCDNDGNILSNTWYSVHKIAGHMVAIEEGE